MARLARFVVPGVPHHVTQRGNGRQRTFFGDADYAAYRELLRVHCAAQGVAVWSWVLMPNHVHLVLVPEHRDALRAALRYVALNPVRARLAARAEDWPWSSVHALLDPARGDGLTETAAVLARVTDFAALLQAGEEAPLWGALRRSESVGRPLGSRAFLNQIEATLGRDPRPGRRGPKRAMSALSP